MLFVSENRVVNIDIFDHMNRTELLGITIYILSSIEENPGPPHTSHIIYDVVDELIPSTNVNAHNTL